MTARGEAGLLRIVIPKKTAPLAVRRNRLRRLIKEALRLDFKLSGGKLYVVYVSKDPGPVGLAQTKKIIHEAWR